MPGLREFWQEHYDHVFEADNSWLDYSNQRVQQQTFGLCIEAADALGGLKCLDLGCGRGQFARCLSACGAQVTAVDLAEDGINANRRESPSIEWIAANLLDDSFWKRLGTYERVFAIESLQYVPFAETLAKIWSKLAPGGRCVVMIPHGECPIVQLTAARFGGNFMAPTVRDFHAAIEKLAAVETLAIRGLSFQGDQRLWPYQVSAWEQNPRWDAPPNRLQLVVQKAEGTPPGIQPSPP